MTKVIKTLVCVGGPKDGARWQTEDGVREIRTLDNRGDVTRYLQERIAGQEVEFSFWRWEVLPIDEAIERLFASYAPTAPLPR